MNVKETAPTLLVMEASKISTPSIRDFTIEMLKVAPPSFRTAKASRNHHPPDERGEYGNALHTLRVLKLVLMMADACDMNRISTDVLESAASLHDVCRYGIDGEAEYTVENHPFLVRELASRHSIFCEYDDMIFRVIENHTGKWGIPPYTPSMSKDDILHIADMISARAEQVWGKAPESWVRVQEETSKSWIGLSETPFKEIGMNEDKMQLLEELAEDSDYWKSALSFVKQVSNRKLSSLTGRQRDWLYDIDATLGVELNKRAAKEVYSEAEEGEL